MFCGASKTKIAILLYFVLISVPLAAVCIGWVTVRRVSRTFLNTYIRVDLCSQEHRRIKAQALLVEFIAHLATTRRSEILCIIQLRKLSSIDRLAVLFALAKLSFLSVLQFRLPYLTVQVPTSPSNFIPHSQDWL